MNEKSKKILEDILQSEDEFEKFLKLDTIDEMYNYFASKDPTLSVQEFDDFMEEMLDTYTRSQNKINKLDPESLNHLAGGANFGTKIASGALALLSLFPASSVGAANKSKSVKAAPHQSMATSVGATDDSKDIKISRPQSAAVSVNSETNDAATSADPSAVVFDETNRANVIDRLSKYYNISKEKATKLYETAKQKISKGYDVSANFVSDEFHKIKEWVKKNPKTSIAIAIATTIVLTIFGIKLKNRNNHSDQQQQQEQPPTKKSLKQGLDKKIKNLQQVRQKGYHPTPPIGDGNSDWQQRSKVRGTQQGFTPDRQPTVNTYKKGEVQKQYKHLVKLFDNRETNPPSSKELQRLKSFFDTVQKPKKALSQSTLNALNWLRQKTGSTHST